MLSIGLAVSHVWRMNDLSAHSDAWWERRIHTKAPLEPLPGCAAYGDECKVQFLRVCQSSTP